MSGDVSDDFVYEMFSQLVALNWTQAEEIAAAQEQLLAYTSYAAYLLWLRNVSAE